jgi:ubiquinone/menaquinone biosynthesis C-methylase UbiE
MKNDDVVNVYSKIAIKYADTFFNELDNKPLDKKLYELFASRVLKNGNCIEIGCGPGEISTYLNSIGTKIVGIDKSKEMVDQAKKHNQNVRFIQGDVFELPFENNCIDGIVAPYLIVNFSDKEIKKAFQEMNRIMKSNSPLLIVFHIGGNKKLKIKNFFGEANKIIFILHSIAKIKKLLRETLFSINEVILKEPYEGEITKRAFIFAKKL